MAARLTRMKRATMTQAKVNDVWPLYLSSNPGGLKFSAVSVKSMLEQVPVSVKHFKKGKLSFGYLFVFPDLKYT